MNEEESLILTFILHNFHWV